MNNRFLNTFNYTRPAAKKQVYTRYIDHCLYIEYGRYIEYCSYIEYGRYIEHILLL